MILYDYPESGDLAKYAGKQAELIQFNAVPGKSMVAINAAHVILWPNRYIQL